MIDFDDVKRFLRGVWVSVLLTCAALCGLAAHRHADDFAVARHMLFAIGFTLWGFISLRRLLAETRS